MTRLLWVNGRLGWPLVVAVAYVSLSVVAVDYSWRVLEMPFAQLAAFSAALDLAVAALLVLVGVRMRGRRPASRRSEE